jgi:hypothetical protein
MMGREKEDVICYKLSVWGVRSLPVTNGLILVMRDEGDVFENVDLLAGSGES